VQLDRASVIPTTGNAEHCLGSGGHDIVQRNRGFPDRAHRQAEAGGSSGDG